MARTAFDARLGASQGRLAAADGSPAPSGNFVFVLGDAEAGGVGELEEGPIAPSGGRERVRGAEELDHAIDRASAPLRTFMLRQTRPADIDLFTRMQSTASGEESTAQEPAASSASLGTRQYSPTGSQASPPHGP